VSRESALRIASLLPDVLGTYSDCGNVTVLAMRARWRGIPVEVSSVPLSGRPPTDCDIYVLGGGEDAAQALAADWLRRRPALCTALRERATTLAVCAGLQVLGCWMQDGDGRRIPGADVVDVTTVRGRRRAVGEVLTRSSMPGAGLLTGFENHQGRTRLGVGVEPLGRVLRGVGNGSGDDGEGVLTPRVIGTYLHGPVLARNPALADALLSAATGQELAPLELPDQEEVRRPRLAVPEARRRRWARLVRASDHP